jgi:hypothetical protein
MFVGISLSGLRICTELGGKAGPHRVILSRSGEGSAASFADRSVRLVEVKNENIWTAAFRCEVGAS